MKLLSGASKHLLKMPQSFACARMLLQLQALSEAGLHVNCVNFAAGSLSLGQGHAFQGDL